MRRWTIETSTGAADEFHQRDPAEVDRPTVWIHRVERPALVLGSTQSLDIVDQNRAAALGVEVCRRRSGGGLVLVEPGSSCWIDVLVTDDSPLWDDDVSRSFLWAGGVWAAALADIGLDRLEVHRGASIDREAGRFLCFAGVGSGEVVRTVPTGGDDGESGTTTSWKVVGLSQRRRRGIARIQGLAVAATDLDLTRSLVLPTSWPDDLDPSDLRIGTGPLDASPAVRDRLLDATQLAERFVAHLPTP